MMHIASCCHHINIGVIMRRMLGFIAVVMAVSGCITTQFSSREKRVEAYLANHPSVSAEIQKGLKDCRMVVGMNEDEVRLCWGKPDNIKLIPVGSSKNESIWYYYDDVNRDDMKSSSMFTMDVPSRRVNLGADNLVYEWKVYDDEIETSRSTALTKTLPRSMVQGKGVNPDGRPVLRAGEFKNWPVVTLTSIVGRGENGSAVLNGQIAAVGEDIDGVKILAVGSYGVKLEYNGQLGMLKKGESTL